MSWEDFKNKKEQNSSWQEFKNRKENPVSVSSPKKQNTSLLQNMQNFVGNTKRTGSNLGLGASSGIKQSFNFALKTGETKNKTEQQLKNQRVLKSKELTEEEKQIYIANQGGKLLSQNEVNEGFNTNKIPIVSSAQNANLPIYNESKVNEIADNNILDRSIKKDQEKIQNNIEQQTGNVSRKLAELAPSIGNMGVGAAISAINPVAGMAYFTTSAGGSYMQDALDRGMTREQATNYGAIMGLMEGATETVGIENFKKAGKGLKTLVSGAGIKAAKEAFKGGTEEIVKNSIKTVLKDYGIGIADNVMQEAIIEPIQEIAAGAIGGKDKANWTDMKQRMLKAGIDGGLTSAILGGANLGIQSCIGVIEKSQNNQNVTQQELQTAVKDASTQVDVEKMITDSTQQQVSKYKALTEQQQTMQNQQNTTAQQITPTIQNNTQNGISEQTNSMLNNKEVPMLNYQYEKSDNVKINNLRQDANKYFNNSEKARNYVSMLERIVTDKNIDIRLDTNLKTPDGKIANGSYSNGVITINPNSARAGEFIAVHELTHAIGTDSMKNIIETYRQSNPEFNTAVEKLLQNYNSTEITEEALADVSAQLFGNQEFINNVAQTNPNIFKKIYREIKYLWHQFRGYKNQDQFVEDLYYKWTQAYNSRNKLNNTSNYSIAGKQGMINAIKADTGNLQLERNYNKAQQMQANGIDNETIRQATGWFQDRNGDWKFEFSDKNMSLKNIKLEKNKTYKLGDLLEHDTLFTVYPQLKNLKIQFENLNKANGNYNKNNNAIRLNNNLIGNSAKIEGTIIHEIQHAIQNVEGFENGTISKLSKKMYYESLGEIEAADTKNRFLNEKYKNKNISNIAPESSKTNPKHKNYDNYMKNRGLLDKVKDSVFKYLKGLGDSNEEYISQNNEENSQDVFQTGENNNRQIWDRIDNNTKESENNSGSFFNEKNIVETDQMKQYSINKPFKLAESYKIYRGISENGNTGTAMYGEGLYTTTNKKYASQFGNVIEIDRSQLPKNPLQFKTEMDFNQWEKELANSLGIPKNKLYNNDNVDKYVKKLGYDGITIGTGKDMTIVTYSNEKYSLQSKDWQSYLNDNFKATGTRTNLQDIKNIAPIAKDIKTNNTAKVELLTDKDYEVLNEIYEKEGKTEILTEKKKAKLLEKYANDKFAIKDSLDILAQKFINKGHYIDKLSEQAKNPELKFIYDKNLNSFAEGQYVVGVAQTDNNGKKIGKSINDIWKPIEDNKLTKEFSEYLLHKHNIDRSERNKFVFGKEIGPAESTKIALELEKKHPEFKQYAKDIKEFNHNNLINLKEAGLITQETIEYMETMYPNYVPISRDVEDSIYVGDNKKVGTNAPIKKATGGSSDIQPIKDTMAQQVIRIKRLINQNKLGQELSKTLKNAKVEQASDIQFAPSNLLELDTLVDSDNKGNKYYTYFEDGILQKLKINDNLYESLRPTEISRIEKTLPLKAIQKVTNMHRSLLTSSNPIFVVTNFFKDIQDGMFNSKYSSKFIKNYGKALSEITTKGKYYESYMANGGMTNTYFDYNEGIKRKNKFTEKIRNVNEIVEQLPRLSEFISTLEDGKSLNEALYNAAEITTNFKRGGDITKAINRNGVNFLNASIQGLDKQFRNFSGQNGAKGYVNLLLKATLMGIAPAILNHMLLDDDDDYEDLPESTKDLYYLFKYNDGKFIRIPKGRVLSIFGSAARRILEMAQGQDDAFIGFKDTVINQMAPNNPLEDNILAPIIQVKNNKTWYGSDLVSSRLQKELPQNQYDETTDEFSKWLGRQLNASPKKINYLIDQYSGGIGDVILPMITPQAKKNVFVDKFTTDSVLKNKNVSKFYETLEKQTQIANDTFATDEDKLQAKYLSEVSKAMSELYKEKREIQMSSISNKEKTKKVRDIQEKINNLSEEGLKNYSNGTYKSNSAKIGDTEYYKNGKDEWVKLSDEEKENNENISTETYAQYKQKIYKETQRKRKNGELEENQNLKNSDKIQILLDSSYSDKEISTLYENYIKSEKDVEYDIMKATDIDIKEYLKYKQQEFESDKYDDGTLTGKTVSKSKQQKFVKYLNSMNIKGNQRLLLYAMQGYSMTSSQKTKVANYVNELKLDKDTKLKLYDKFNGFKVYKDGTVKY